MKWFIPRTASCNEDWKKEIIESSDKSDKTLARFIDYDTAAIMISFNSYDPSDDKFLASNLIFEFSLAGNIIPNDL